MLILVSIETKAKVLVSNFFKGLDGKLVWSYME